MDQTETFFPKCYLTKHKFLCAIRFWYSIYFYCFPVNQRHGLGLARPQTRQNEEVAGKFMEMVVLRGNISSCLSAKQHVDERSCCCKAQNVLRTQRRRKNVAFATKWEVVSLPQMWFLLHCSSLSPPHASLALKYSLVNWSLFPHLCNSTLFSLSVFLFPNYLLFSSILCLLCSCFSVTKDWK